jgi:DNA-binding transcriptional regulator YhcF (GntR family)
VTQVSPQSPIRSSDTKLATVGFVNQLSVDPDSTVAPFEQVRAQIADAIGRGELPPEARLPTVRQLAADLGLAVNTVARSYRELETAGLVETRGRNGTFVAGAPSESRRLATSAAREFISRMRELGIGEAESVAIVRRELEAGH